MLEHILLIDTETTGRDDKDRVIQIAYKVDDGHEIHEREAKYSTDVPIEIGAMATHHITEQMIADKPKFMESPEHSFLERVKDKVVFVAHNASFDLGMLAKEGLEFPRHICTLKVMHYLDVDAKLERHSLQYLRYYYGVDCDSAIAHDAMGDVIVLEQLFLRQIGMMQMMHTDLTPEECIEKMVDISSKPTLFRKFTFGKHEGKLVADACKEDRDYLKWLLGAKEESVEKGEKKPEEEADWIFTLRYNLGMN